MVNLIPQCAVDFESPDFISDPYPHYERMRKTPVCRLTNGMLAITTYADLKFVLQRDDLCSGDAEVFKNPAWLPAEYARTSMLLNECPATHRKHRKIFQDALSGRVIAQLSPAMREYMSQQLAHVTGRTIEFMESVAYPFVAIAMRAVTGVSQDFKELKEWATLIESILAMGDNPPQKFVERYIELYQRQYEFYQGVIDTRRQQPGQDFVSALLEAKVNDRSLTDNEIRDGLDLMVFAGFQTTSLQIGMFVLYLSEHPQLFAQIKAEPDRIPDCVRELLRLRGVAQATIRRARQTFTLPSGHEIPKDALLWVGHASGNYDPDRFQNPEVFDSTRENLDDMLTFSTGNRFCVGARLARSQLNIAMEEIVKRVDHITCDAAKVSWRLPLTHRVIDNLEVMLR